MDNIDTLTGWIYRRRKSEREIKDKTQEFWHGQLGGWCIIHRDRKHRGLLKVLEEADVFGLTCVCSLRWVYATSIWIYSIGLEFR